MDKDSSIYIFSAQFFHFRLLEKKACQILFVAVFVLQRSRSSAWVFKRDSLRKDLPNYGRFRFKAMLVNITISAENLKFRADDGSYPQIAWTGGEGGRGRVSICYPVPVLWRSYAGLFGTERSVPERRILASFKSTVQSFSTTCNSKAYLASTS